MVRLLSDDQLRQRIASAAAHTAREYSVEDVVSDIELSYAELARPC